MKPSTQQRKRWKEGKRIERRISPSTFTSAKHVQQKGARAVRLPNSTEGNAEQKDAEKKKEEGTNLRSVMVPATRAAPVGQGSGPSDPLWHCSLSPLFVRRSACRFFFLETSRSVRCPCTCTRLPCSGNHERQQLFQSRPVAGNHSIEARLGAVPGRDGTTQGWDNSLATASPAQNPGHISDERVTNALRMMQDPLQ